MNCKGLEENFEIVLSVYPNSKGYAYALMQGPLTILKKKMVGISPIDNTKIIYEITKLMEEYSPDVIILEDPMCKYARKSSRGKQLLRSISSSAKYQGIKVYSYSREDIRLVFEIWKAQSKFEIAEVIAKNIKSFRILLYQKPKYPSQQCYFEALFDAVSLGITYYYKTT